MITLPSVLTYKDIAVYPDTDDCNLFYCLREAPHVRINNAGEPAFHGTFWSGAKADDETVGGFKGGRISFDLNLAISEEDKVAIKERIRTSGIQERRSNQIIAQAKKRENLISAITKGTELKDANGKPIPTSNAMSGFLDGEKEAEVAKFQPPGNITFGAVAYTSGKVDIVEDQVGDNQEKREISLVEWHSGSSKPSMIGSNNASTVMNLTPTGAAVFNSWINEDRRIDAKVIFDLTLKMSMPALDVTISAGTVQAGSLSEHIDHRCSKEPDYRKITQVLTEMGFINITINNEAGLDESVVESVKESMMGTLNMKIEDIIKSKILPMTPEEREKKLETVINEEFKYFTEMNFTERSSFDFNFCPQTSIIDFFENVKKEDLKKVVTLVDLSKQEFSWKEITLCANAPWKYNNKPFVNMIKVECEYPSLPEGHQERIRSFLFKEGDVTTEWEFMQPKNDTGTIKYTPYVYLEGGSDCIKLPTQTAQGNYVMVNVGKIGIIDLEFQVHPNALTLRGDMAVTGMLVELWYNDANGKLLMGPEQIVTNDLTKPCKFERNLEAVLDQPVHYKTTYFFDGLDPITLDEKTYYLSNNGSSTIIPELPFKNRKKITVELPLSPSSDVKEISGEIFYGNQSFPVKFSKDEDGGSDAWEPQSVNLFALDEEIKDYNYQFNLKYTNDDLEMVRSGKLQGDSTSSLLVVPLKQIKVYTDLLEHGVKYLFAQVVINLPEGSGVPIELDLRKDTGIKKFYLFYPEDKKFELNWSMNLCDMEGNQLPVVYGKTENNNLVLTPPKNKE